MSRVAVAIGCGLSASLGFVLVYAHLRCCEGEAGFAQNSSIAGLVAAGIVVVAIYSQPAWRVRPFLCAVATIVWCIIVAVTFAGLRPTWNDYVFAHSLHLVWRTLAVFGAAATSWYLLSFGIRARPMRDLRAQSSEV